MISKNKKIKLIESINIIGRMFRYIFNKGLSRNFAPKY